MVEKIRNPPMRELKFRFWDEETKQMMDAKKASEFGKHYITFNGKVVQPAILKPGILMQFIGLTDRNGKEIYESDIVKVEDRIMTVIWDKFGAIAWAFKHSTSGCEFIYSYHNEKYEVLGNIYENPELLEASDA